MHENSDAVIIGGMPNEIYGRALGPYRIRTVLEAAGYTTSILDNPWSFAPDEIITVLDFVIGDKTKFIGISCTWAQENLAAAQSHWLNPQFLNLLCERYPNVHIVLAASSSIRIQDELIPYADWLIGGFSEDSAVQLMLEIEGKPNVLIWNFATISGHRVKFVNSNTDHIVQDMDRLATTFKSTDYYAYNQPLTIETCRGCVFSCAYCSYPFLGKKSYAYIRSVENLAAELKSNYDMFGTYRYMIADDTFNDTMEKLERMQRAIDMAKLPKFEFVSYIRAELLVIRPEMIPALINLGLKGCHFGIESFSNVSRKAIGRTTDIHKVIAAIRKLKDSGIVYTHGSLIAGLPGDSISDIEGWRDILFAKDRFLDSWSVSPLLIGADNLQQTIAFKGVLQAQENRSLIEKNPAQYGYTINGRSGPNALWTNKHMDFKQAGKLSHQLAKDSMDKMHIGGWSLGAAWYMNYTEDEIRDTIFDNEKFNDAGRSVSFERSRLILRDIQKARDVVI